MSFDSTLREVEVEKTSDNDRNKESGDLQIARKKVTSNVMRCSVCQMSFDSRNEQKAHYQTDYHLMNVKRNLRGLDILSVEEFDALISKEHDTSLKTKILTASKLQAITKKVRKPAIGTRTYKLIIIWKL